MENMFWGPVVTRTNYRRGELSQGAIIVRTNCHWDQLLGGLICTIVNWANFRLDQLSGTYFRGTNWLGRIGTLLIQGCHLQHEKPRHLTTAKRKKCTKRKYDFQPACWWLSMLSVNPLWSHCNSLSRLPVALHRVDQGRGERLEGGQTRSSGLDSHLSPLSAISCIVSFHMGLDSI